MSDGLQWFADNGRLMMLQLEVMRALDLWIEIRGAAQEDALITAYQAYAQAEARQRKRIIDTAVQRALRSLPTFDT